LELGRRSLKTSCPASCHGASRSSQRVLDVAGLEHLPSPTISLSRLSDEPHRPHMGGNGAIRNLKRSRNPASYSEVRAVKIKNNLEAITDYAQPGTSQVHARSSRSKPRTRGVHRLAPCPPDCSLRSRNFDVHRENLVKEIADQLRKEGKVVEKAHFLCVFFRNILSAFCLLSV